jgi:hypothetical protein
VTNFAEEIDGKWPYYCTNHKMRYAWSSCASCAKLMCESCALRVGSEQMCLECSSEERRIHALYESEMQQFALQKKLKELAVKERIPQRISDLPRAALDLLSAPQLFFKRVDDVRFGVSFIFALLCLLPTFAISAHQIAGDHAPYTSLPLAAKLISIALSGLIQSAVVIICADLIIQYSARIFGTRTQLRFTSAANIVHFSTFPLLLAAIPIPVFTYIALGLSLSFISIALRSAHGFTWHQSLLSLLPACLVLVFIF